MRLENISKLACKKVHEKKEKSRQEPIWRELKLLRQLLGVTDRLLECAEERMKSGTNA